MTSPRIALLWSFAERYVNTAIFLVASMIIARLLTPAEIGKFSLCAAALAIAGTIREFGVSEYLIQEKELTQDKLRGAFAVAVTTAWSVGLLVYFAREPIARYYAEPELRTIISILAINFLILPLATPAFALLSREMAFRKVFLIQTCAALLQSGVGVGLALFGYGAASLAWGSVAGIAAQAVIISFFRPASSFIWPSFRSATPIFRYGLLSASGRIMDTTTAGAHEFIIAKLFGFTQVGLFSRAKGLVDILTINVSTAVARVATPALAKAHRAGEKLTWSYARGTVIFTSLAWPFYLFLAIAAPEIVLVMFGEQWHAASPICSLLAMSMLPSALYALSPSTLAAMGHVERRLKISLLFNPFHLVSLFVAANLGGVEAMAVAWLLTSLVLLGLHTYHLMQVLDAKLLDLYAPCIGSIGVSLAVATAQWLTMLACRHWHLSSILSVAIAMVTCSLCWMVVARALKHPAYDEIANAFSAMRRARKG